MRPLPPLAKPSLPAAAALAFCLSGCLGPEGGGGSYLRIQNPGLTAGLDSLLLTGINAVRGDSILIRRWLKGTEFPPDAPYPPGLEDAFTLLARGFIADVLVYQSRTAVAGGKAGPPVRDFRLAAPALADVPAALAARIGDAVTLEPAWEDRPGVYRLPDSGGAETFTPEASFAWTRGGQVIGRDSVLDLRAVTFADSGGYAFLAENRAGRDSMRFALSVRHMLPRIAEIKPQSALAGRALSVKPAIARSDSLQYRWMKGGGLVSTDSVLSFAALAAKDTGSWQLAAANASDTAEKTLSNRFTISFAPDPDEIWKPEKSFRAGAQANSGLGTTLDLDVAKAMLISEAEQKQPLIDLLFVYSGSSLKLMSAVAAKRAADLDYADDFDDAKIKDVKLVKVTAKPAAPAAGRAAYDAGPQANSMAVAAGQSFLVKTTDGNLAWLKIESIQGGAGSSASADFTVAIAPY